MNLRQHNAEEEDESTGLELASLVSSASSSRDHTIRSARSPTTSSIFDFQDDEDTNLPSVPLSRLPIDSAASSTRVVTFKNGLGLVIGLQIGSGIFSTPGLVAQVGSPGASILVWIASGLLAWTGATSYAELGSCIPFNGGSHAYLQFIYGDLPAFLFSWTGIIALKPGSGAIISIIAAEYLTDIFYTALGNSESTPPPWLTKVIAILCVGAVSLIVGLSTKTATRVNDAFTVTKILTLLGITAMGFIWLGLGKGTDVYTRNPFAGSTLNGGTYALALYSGLWAFDGWDNCSYVANEMVNPARDIPRVVHTAQPIVILAYVLANLAYFAVLPLKDIQETHAVALDFGNIIFGRVGGLILAVAVVCSSLGALLSSSFTSARLIAVSGEQLEIPALFGRLHPKTNTPVNAIVLQACLMSVYIVIGDFERLVTFYGVSAWIFFFATVLGLIVLRVRRPGMDRPYKTWFSTPIIFCCVALFLVVRGVFEAPAESGLGILFIIVGIPVYYIRMGVGKLELKMPRKLNGVWNSMKSSARQTGGDYRQL